MGCKVEELGLEEPILEHLTETRDKTVLQVSEEKQSVRLFLDKTL